MKKHILFVILVMTCFFAKAQIIDTLFWFDREPTFYYWDTNWIDYKMMTYQDVPNLEWLPSSFWYGTCQPEFARYCYTDSSLRIIGVAALLYITAEMGQYAQGNPWEKMLPEYFRLYEVDSTTDEMIMLASARWDTTTPRYRMVTDFGNEHLNGIIYDFRPVYEAYFDTPITVHDSFYVSTTMFNNYSYECNYYYYSGISINLKGYEAIIYDPTSPTHANYWEPACIPNPPHNRRKLHLLDERNYDTELYLTDTLWHYYLPSASSSRPYYAIFPIFDTSRSVPPAPCPTPQRLSASYVSSEVCLFTWSGDNGQYWELAIGDPDMPPESANIRQCYYDIATVQDLDTGRCYAAWVRTVCDTNRISDWSDSIHFCVRSGVAGIASEAESLTHVYPNPAKNTVRITSAYNISQVELFSLNGMIQNHATVDGNDISLDISHVEKGSYLLKIVTDKGTTIKKIVKQ